MPDRAIMTDATMHDGSLPSGSRYTVAVPREWNGALLVRSRPVPVGPGEPPWEPGEPLIGQLLEHGYAVAGSASTIFWPVELVLSDLPSLLDISEGILGAPRHTIAFGFSIGGIISAGAVQRFPDRLSGALPMCANLAGAVANHNRELDIAFVVKTLLAADTGLALVDITDAEANLVLATNLLHQAQATAAGRARLALAAAVGNVPGWHHPAAAEPAPDDFEARQRNQFAWFEEVGFLVYFLARQQVELQAGGNPSWNTGVDYGVLLAASINREQVEALYAAAALDLADDLGRLAAAPRIAADPGAVTYLERHIVFNGDLGGVPVLSVHTDGDGLVTPDQEHAYAEVVGAAGDQDLLRQLYVHRGGHCTFTFAETLTALDVLVERIESGAWPAIDPETLNAAAARLGAHSNVSVRGMPVAAGFIPFEPSPFSRRYDARDIRAT